MSFFRNLENSGQRTLDAIMVTLVLAIFLLVVSATHFVMEPRAPKHYVEIEVTTLVSWEAIAPLLTRVILPTFEVNGKAASSWVSHDTEGVMRFHVGMKPGEHEIRIATPFELRFANHERNCHHFDQKPYAVTVMQDMNPTIIAEVTKVDFCGDHPNSESKFNSAGILMRKKKER